VDSGFNVKAYFEMKFDGKLVLRVDRGRRLRQRKFALPARMFVVQRAGFEPANPYGSGWLRLLFR